MLRKGRIARFVISIIIILGIVFGILWATGLLTSNQAKFQKEISYLRNPIKNLLYSPNENFHRLARLQNYTKEGTATFRLDGYNQKNVEEKIEENTQIEISGRINGSEKQSYTEYRWLYGDTEILKVKTIRDDQKIGIQSDEIVNAYVAVENTNIIQLLQNFDLEFPYGIQQIEFNSLVDLFELENIEEQELENYISVLKENTKKENYTKTNQTFSVSGEEKEVTGYQLHLSAEETKILLIQICENLQQDSITLNMISKKMKTIGFSEEMANVNQINAKIDEWKQGLQNNQIKTQETTITFYSWKKIFLQCEIQYGENRIVMNQDQETGKVVLQWKIGDMTGEVQKQQKEGNQTSLQIAITQEGEEQLQVTVDSEEKNTGIRNTISLLCQDGYGTASIDYTEENTFQSSIEQIEHLSQSNSVTLNEYEKEPLQTLWQAIKNQWEFVYENKRNTLLQIIP